MHGKRRGLGLLAGAGMVWLIAELPYVNWHSAIPPVDQRPLVIRKDAKGGGHFAAPRSGNRKHRGIDLTAPLDSPVRAIRSGRVLEVGTHRGLGRYVELEHPGDLRSLYAHLNQVRVKPGLRVKQGQPIGTVGKTGNARHRWITPHVHLEVLRGGAPIDPQGLGLELEPAAGGALASAESDESSDASGGE